MSRRGFLGWAGASGAAGAAVASARPARAAQVIQQDGADSIAAENALPGSPVSEWESWGNDDAIVGFTTEFSVDSGATVSFKIKTDSAQYRIRIYRLGWYQGNGARHLADVVPSVSLPQAQPDPLTEPDTGLIDCGNWQVSATWTVPGDALSGVYYALFDRLDGGQSNHTIFVVRRSGPADILLQTSEMTMHAYNRYGGNSLYFGEPVGRAYKVSYNRPFNNGEAESNFFNAEVALLRWLERNGYDVAYCGGIDVHRDSTVFQGRAIFISSGHDEYVSGPQRANVEAARDAGVNLIFMTGNEYFWRVRFADSIDASATPERTMVCYKETLADAKIDPLPEWTGTWRDPRFSPPSNGGRPENALTGQFFRAILPVSSPDKRITVPAQFANHRLWRNTAVANLQPGQSRDLSPNTLGYEFDVDADNGFRPPGLIRLSTTEAEAPQILQDYGSTYVAGTVTHHLTMYRAASGALVFGMGTVQWSYGLDDYHICDPSTPTDEVMQQATLNLLADLGAQPATRQPELVAASASTDTLAPTTTITSPAGGAPVPIGSPVTVTGTAADAGGGVVASVEVSVDAGDTWHPTTGLASWSYVFTPLATGDLQVRARAVDDSCNIGDTVALALVGAPRSYPCSIWAEGSTPETSASNESTPIEVGVRFQADIDGFITGLRFYKGVGNGGTHVGRLWSTGGAELVSATFSGESASGWQTVPVAAVPVAAGTTYIASVFMPQGKYAADAGYFGSAYHLAPLRALANGEEGGSNGLYRYGSTGFPTESFGSSNYWVDVLFDTDNHQAPTMVDHAPAAGLQSVSLSTEITATFSEAVVESSISMTLTSSEGEDVVGTTSYEAATRTATLVPAAALQPLAQYTAQVATAEDVEGNPITPVTWVFTTTGPPGTSPTSLWDTSATPDGFDADPSPVELGVKFRSVAVGSISALRFYKAPSSSGTHVAHLWDESGALLATATYASETASGWQQVNLAAPVEIVPGTTYVASYHAPRGVYGASAGYFNATATERGPLRAPEGRSVGGNGVFAFGGGDFPTSSWGNGNYWVDVVFHTAPDERPPEAANVVPAPELSAVARDTVVTVEFDELVDGDSIVFSLHTAGGAPVASSVGYDAATATATLTPASQLDSGATYTASVAASDDSGIPMAAPVTWSFTTVTTPPSTLWDSSALPATEAISESSAVEVGVRVSSGLAGQVTGLRFYKGPGNEGPHVGHLWTSTGVLLGTLTFAQETKRGWQQAYFADPVAIDADTTYVASYHAPNGHYAATGGGLSNEHANGVLSAPASTGAAGNGLFAYGSGGFPSNSWGASNYWVDIIFADVSGPSVVDRSPQPAATVDPSSVVWVTFGEAVAAASISMSLRDGGGSVVPGSVSYDAESRTATLTPANPLAPGSAFTAALDAAQDMQGNALAETVSWGFATIGAQFTTIWPTNTTPSTTTVNDPGGLEAGVKFRADSAGEVHGIRFYKGGPSNSGPHSGTLWASDGTLLATVQFGGETARGWQTAMFSSPVPVEPDTTYVASYFTPAGFYSVDGGYFNGGGTVSGHLEALQNGEDGGNGVYRYGAGTGFPAQSYNGANYWVDVLFVAD